MTHAEMEELLGAYAIDAVDADEAAAIDAHLPYCPKCRAEVAELREVAALLAHSGAAAPEGVWDRISSSIDDVPPPMRLDLRRESSRRSRWLAIPAAAAAVVIVVLAAAVFRLQGQVDDLEQAGRSADITLAAERALSAPDARIARLTGDSGSTAIAVVRPDGQGFFLGSGLPALDGRIYELWGATASGSVTALGTVPGPGVYGFVADPSITVVMVTEEERPVNTPTSAAIVTGTLV